MLVTKKLSNNNTWININSDEITKHSKVYEEYDIDPKTLEYALDESEHAHMDYAAEMMAPAKERAALAGIENIHFQQGDVGALPFPEESFDIVLSMNGFHVFPDKEAAYQEVSRVLKSGGIFCGCFYVEGGVKRADWFAKHIYVPKGLFTPPFETEESLRKRLMESYKEVSVERVETVACFSCVKK